VLDCIIQLSLYQHILWIATLSCEKKGFSNSFLISETKAIIVSHVPQPTVHDLSDVWRYTPNWLGYVSSLFIKKNDVPSDEKKKVWIVQLISILWAQ